MNIRLYKAIFFLIFFQISLVFPQDFNWEIITNLNNGKEIFNQDSRLYVATNGGFIAYSIPDDRYEVYTTQNGITEHNFTAAGVSDKGMVILGTLNGMVTFYDMANGTLHEDFSLSGNEIISIQSIEDTMWIALKEMIAVYLYNQDKEAFEFRDFFPNFNRNFETFHQIYYFDRKIWAASDDGLFYASGNFLRYNLKSADNWNTLTTSNGLPHNTVYSLDSIEDTLFIGTETGVSKFVNQTFFNFGTVPIQKMTTLQNDLYVGNTRNIYLLKGSRFTAQYRSTINNINDFTVDDSQNLWISFEEKY